MFRDDAWAGRSGTASCYSQPIAVWVDERALPTGESFFVDGDTELLGHSIDVPDIEMNQRVRPGIALVLGEVQPDVSARHRDKPGEAGLELMLPLLRKPESLIPSHSASRIFDVEHRDDFLVHGETLIVLGTTGDPRLRECSGMLPEPLAT